MCQFVHWLSQETVDEFSISGQSKKKLLQIGYQWKTFFEDLYYPWEIAQAESTQFYKWFFNDKDKNCMVFHGSEHTSPLKLLRVIIGKSAVTWREL